MPAVLINSFRKKELLFFFFKNEVAHLLRDRTVPQFQRVALICKKEKDPEAGANWKKLISIFKRPEGRRTAYKKGRWHQEKILRKKHDFYCRKKF